MIAGRVIEFPQSKAPEVAMFPTYYDSVADEVTIPLLPSDPDTAAAILGTWALLLVDYGVLGPDDVAQVIRKAIGKKG
jgi:hypothetical protein